jgi:hypothetical protein
VCDVTDEDQVRHFVEVAASGTNLDVLAAAGLPDLTALNACNTA